MRRSAWAMALSAVLLAGCGSSQSSASHEVVSAGDLTYALGQLRTAYTGDEIQPASLRDSLPNHHYLVGKTAKAVRFSDAVVLGRVTKVQKGNGVIWRDDHDFTVIDYDDTMSDTRSALVTMTVDHATGAIDPTAKTVTFRVIVPAQADPQKFMEGLAALQRIAVVLHNDPNAAESTPWRPILGDRLIGVVGPDGSLTLPAMVKAAAFEGELSTQTAFIAAAQAPVTVHHVPRP
jgi:hypothetical protein